MTRRTAIAGTLLAAAAIPGGFVLASGDDPPSIDPARAAAGELSASQLVGQRLITGYVGSSPTGSVLRAIRRGRVGGVILFADNVPTERTARRVVRRLQREARIGRQPQLLVMIDQEGGEVKRIKSIPPTRSPAAIGSSARRQSIARSQGRATGKALHRLGINVDLAPVADVPAGPSSFLGTRAFSTNRARVAVAACAFAQGLSRRNVGSAFKHFPGLGRAGANTDDRPVEVTASATALKSDLLPYRRCPATVSLVMIASATYPSLGIRRPAVLSRTTYTLLAATGFDGPTISDALDTPAIAGQRNHQRRAALAGLDLLLYGQTSGGAGRAYARLRAAVRRGVLSEQALRASATRILRLKQRLGARPDPAS
ncbi:MAG: glycoside hydrolase family 3 N-terminal domain-containing protein [Solirubrobacterales bacterium]